MGSPQTEEGDSILMSNLIQKSTEDGLKT
jgi:hypothetical protein